MKIKALEDRHEQLNEAIFKAQMLAIKHKKVIHVHEYTFGHFTVNEDMRLGSVHACVKVLASGGLRFFCLALGTYVSVPNG